MQNGVLFICTGNYYRSRYAEILFNHYTQIYGLTCSAWSRGLQESNRPFPISINAKNRLKTQGLEYSNFRYPIKLREEELEMADRIILMDELEHRPMMAEQYPEWISRVMFWQVRDIQFVAPQHALPKLELEVHKLLHQLIQKKVSA